MTDDIYSRLSAERKKGQEEGKYPDWFTTGGYQMFKESYEYEADGFLEQITRVAETAALYAPEFLEETHPLYNSITSAYGKGWKTVFKNILWEGHFAPATPVLANTGTGRGMSVSCSGNYVGDSVQEFYGKVMENALLSKQAFGTSSYLGDIRSRGSKIKGGGTADGSWPVFEMNQDMAKRVSQAGVRRGSWAGYLPIDHGDFDEWCNHLLADPKGKNVGWNISKEVIAGWEAGDKELHRRRAKALKTKCTTGKGYFWKVDHVNDQQPECYKARGLTNKASNLCTEITLFADELHTYTCIISSMNALFYDIWKKTGGVFVATVILHCIAKLFIALGKNIPGLERAIRYTEKAQSLGLGLLGFHSYLQSKMVAIEEYTAHRINLEMFDHLNQESLQASQWLAQVEGEPEWCKGFGIAHTHRVAVAPNLSSSVLAGQVSQGIEPWIANVFMQDTSAGEMQRINPQLLKLMQERGKYNKVTLRRIIENKGSVLDEAWLDDHEKLVFRTAFEIDQKALLRLASTRQKYIDQAQSLNLFFDSEEDPAYIAEVHEEFFKDPYLKSLYYLRSERGIRASKDECVACSG